MGTVHVRRAAKQKNQAFGAVAVVSALAICGVVGKAYLGNPEQAADAKAAIVPLMGGARQDQSTPKPTTSPSMAPININTGTRQDLERLPRIGPAIAQRIIDYRNAHGRFRSIEELDNVKGIGPATLAKIRPYCVL